MAEAIDRLDELVVRLLLEFGVEMGGRGRGGSWLHAAAAGADDPRTVDFCLGLGLDPNGVDDAGWTPLHYAATYGYDGCTPTWSRPVRILWRRLLSGWERHVDLRWSITPSIYDKWSASVVVVVEAGAEVSALARGGWRRSSHFELPDLGHGRRQMRMAELISGRFGTYSPTVRGVSGASSEGAVHPCG